MVIVRSPDDHDSISLDLLIKGESFVKGMTMNRYEFLTALHHIIKPRRYLEIGVQTGASLTLAKDAEVAVGVDPDMSNLMYHPANAVLCEVTSDAFFLDHQPDFTGPDGLSHLDLVFIDGLHHSEQVWRDLANSMALGHKNTVYVLDDVLPRNQEEANRVQCPGDWTGDVFKVLDAIGYVLDKEDPQTAELLTVDTFPTGIAVIAGYMNTAEMWSLLATQLSYFTDERFVPADILNRDAAYSPDDAIELVTEWFTK